MNCRLRTTSAVVSLDNEIRSSSQSTPEIETFTIPPRLERSCDDAVNGVALSLFYIVRGVPGRLHSKAGAPASILTMKTVSNIAKLLQLSGDKLNDKQNEVFEILNPNLSSSSHFLRQHTLTLLNTCPHALM